MRIFAAHDSMAPPLQVGTRRCRMALARSSPALGSMTRAFKE
jgi:hypothetical protein